MRERKYDELLVYKTSNNNFVDKKEILDIIANKGQATVYITDYDDTLIGIVTRGDIIHSNGALININCDFTYLNGYDAYEGRRIFLSNGNIDKIPVLDEYGRLIGDYSRFTNNTVYWDYIINQSIVWGNTKNYLRYKHISKVNIVKPAIGKEYLLKDIEVILDTYRITYDVISKEEYGSCKHSLIVFVDEDDRLATDCLVSQKSEFSTLNNIYSVDSLYHEIRNYENKKHQNAYSLDKEGISIPSSLKKLAYDGIRLLCLFNGADDDINGEVFWRQFAEKNHKYNKQYNIKEMEYWPEGTQMYYEYFSDLLEIDGYKNGTAQKLIIDGHRRHSVGDDFSNGYCTVCNGERIVYNQPEKYENVIYFLGPCIIMGAYVEDKYTIESILQNEINKERLPYKVVNRGGYKNIYDELSKISLVSGDIVVVWSGCHSLEGIPGIDIKTVFRENNVTPGMFLGCLTHTNHKANQFIADSIKEWIENNCATIKKIEKKEVHFKIDNYGDVLGGYIKNLYIDKYFTIEEKKNSSNTGTLIVWTGINPDIIRNIVYEISNEFQRLIVFIPESWRSRLCVYQFDEYVSALYGIGQSVNCQLEIVSGEDFVPYEPLVRGFGDGFNCNREEVNIHFDIFYNCIAKVIGIDSMVVYDVNDNYNIEKYNDWMIDASSKYADFDIVRVNCKM